MKKAILIIGFVVVFALGCAVGIFLLNDKPKTEERIVIEESVDKIENEPTEDDDLIGVWKCGERYIVVQEKEYDTHDFYEFITTDFDSQPFYFAKGYVTKEYKFVYTGEYLNKDESYITNWLNEVKYDWCSREIQSQIEDRVLNINGVQYKKKDIQPTLNISLIMFR